MQVIGAQELINHPSLVWLNRVKKELIDFDSENSLPMYIFQMAIQLPSFSNRF